MIDYRVRINGIDVDARYTEAAADGIFLPLLEKLRGVLDLVHSCNLKTGCAFAHPVFRLELVGGLEPPTC